MDLFEYKRKNILKKEGPLASRIRPESLEDFFGQEEIIGENKFLYRAIKSDKLTSLIFYGPSGTGKTTLAKIIAKNTKSYFEELNATIAGIKDLKEVISNAEINISMTDRKTILFIDEIHRFNKSQQDFLLPYVEKGSIILIGATTENPFFEVNKALISRSNILELKPLSNLDIKNIIKKAILDKKNGFGNIKIKIDEDTLDFIAQNSNGDARKALNTIELAVLTTNKNKDNHIHINLDIIKNCIQKSHTTYDKDGNDHYDTISAFIKSMRGSDPDASIFYLAKMLYGGEDPKFIARRIIICASEDVGNADPRALQVAVSAFQALEFIGMPEARIVLAQAVTYIACAPKSNASYLAIDKSLQDLKNGINFTIPNHLKDAHYFGSEKLNNGVGYKYPHDYENNFTKQQYLPNELKNKVYYNFSDNGYELKMKKWIKHLNNK